MMVPVEVVFVDFFYSDLIVEIYCFFILKNLSIRLNEFFFDNLDQFMLENTNISATTKLIGEGIFPNLNLYLTTTLATPLDFNGTDDYDEMLQFEEEEDLNNYWALLA